MNAEIKYWFLKEHKLFKNLSFSEIDSLCILSRFKKSRKDEILDLPFSEKDRIYYLKVGSIKLLRIDEHGDEILIDILQKGDLFGELKYDNEIKINEYMRVVSHEAIICTFFRENLEEVMMKKPDFALNYIKFKGFTYNKLQNNYRNILYKDSKTRLGLFILSLIEKEDNIQDNFILPSFITQKDIGQLICCSRQTIISLFKELESEGIITYNESGQTVIKNIPYFKNLSKM